MILLHRPLGGPALAAALLIACSQSPTAIDAGVDAAATDLGRDASVDQALVADATADTAADTAAPAGPCLALAGRKWVLREVDVIGGAPIYPELAIDPTTGRPVAAFRKGTATDRYAAIARFDGASWSAPETIEQAPGKHLGKRPSLAVDAAGGLHVTAYDEDGLRLRYGHRPAGGSWSVMTLFDEPGSDAGDHSALVLDPSGALRVTFLQYGVYRVIYGAQQAAGDDAWSYEPLATGAGAAAEPVRGSSSSLALDGQGRPHVAFFTGKHLHYATRADGPASGWTVEVVDEATDKTGHYPSLALDATGAPQVTYLDWSDPSALRFARRDPAGGWSTQTVDDDLGITYTTAMVHQPCGATLLLYVRNDSDGGDDGLWLAARPDDGAPFALHLVDDRSLVSGVALAAAADGRLHAIYLDETSYVLKHAELPP